MTPNSEKPTGSHLPNAQQRQRRSRHRRWLDRGWHALITLAGVSVIATLLAIFVYLLLEVLPLFKPVSAQLQPHAASTPPPALILPSIADDDLAMAAAKAGFAADFQLIDGLKRVIILAKRDGEACVLLRAALSQGCQQRLSLTDRTVQLTAATWLAGQQSLITGDSSGQLKQWYLIADAAGQLRLSWVKPFSQQAAAIVAIAAERGRRGFAVLDANGGLSVFYSALSSAIWQAQYATFSLAQKGVTELRFTPNNDGLWLLSAQQAEGFLAINNRHPEISWRTLWQKVWYESWQQPEYVWQSGGGYELYQGKYSLVPLTVGTLKAAFYALLVAVPLAVLAAIFSVCFLQEPVRSHLSSMIELMALFPTVIIGFLAAIWLAPALEQHLLSLLLYLLLVPAAVWALAYYWHYLPRRWQHLNSSGATLILMSAILLIGAWVALGLGSWFESLLFEDSLRFWLDQQGVDYQQRNALVIGLAMGFAVLPVIYTVSYDALAQIPQQLTAGAYALGANQWQIVRRIMLPVAMPGFLAAVMLGLSRAIGETMIILMATGNNPITNFNLFEGLRSLTATLTIELPEAAVDSSHYRVLFLVAILLFVFTFAANTLADLVRQRLRRNLQRLE
ncbi:ABC transporter permease subunit [Alishewanella sp. 16-MA]|uniref:ABC transporter permease subunit n=1 Tax=Alishewanella maricola TaxID=2795740 RepID=A0ABS8BZ73_9ALTE|nr:ABC transporter permease subunit [Alishewanella maricola]MCB5225369.1 ABC transporter permease subunit [Alishewanella maricola]